MDKFEHIPFIRSAYLDVLEAWAAAYWDLEGADMSFSRESVPNQGLVTLWGKETAVISLMVDVPETAGSMHFMLIVGPDLPQSLRRSALHAHLDGVVAHSTSLGNSYQIWLCDHAGLARTLDGHGFKHQSSSACAFMIRTAPEAPRIAYFET